MCLQCNTAPVYFGDPIPGWVLARSRVDDPEWPIGFWGLIDGQNNPEFVWELTPTPSPVWGTNDDEDEAWWDADSTSEDDKRRVLILADDPLGEQFREVFAQVSIRDGYRLTKAGMDRGFDPAENIWDLWFFDYLGEYLRTAPARYDDEFDRAFVAAGGVIDTTIGRGPYAPRRIISSKPSKHRRAQL